MKRTCMIWVSSAALLFSAMLSASEVIPDACSLCIKTPSLSQRKTLKLKLNNGLSAYLISDPDSADAACAIACDVGSWHNPPERHGLAHFVEHVLFLGSEAYPSESDFHAYVEEHGGRTNAYTTDQYTAYLFNLQDHALEGALDRLSHFFIDPLFNLDSMRREQKAVDEEFQRTLENDGRRQLMVLKALANPQHPFSRFGAGNALTLGSTTSEEIRSWFQAHYSAPLMHLVILSSRPLDELRLMTERYFELIPDRQVGPFNTPGCQLCDKSRGQVIYVNPHKQTRELSLIWELPYDYALDVQTHSADLVSFVLGQEGDQSLLAQLKEEGLADKLSCGVLRLRKEFTPTYLIMLDIELSELGLQQRDQVIARCFQTIATLQTHGIPDYVYQEFVTARRLGYEYQSRHQPFEAVSEIIDKLVQEDLATFPQRSLIPDQFTPTAIEDLCKRLTVEDCHVMITAPSNKTGVPFTLHEPWLGAAYAVHPVSLEERQRWQAHDPGVKLGIPAPNPFMPNDPNVYYRGDPQRTIPVPTEIASDNYGIYFTASDRLYLVPEIAWRFRILSGAVKPGDPQTAVLLDLLATSIRERLSKIAYAAQAARLNFHIDSRKDGIEIALDGCDQKALILFEQIMEAFTDGVPTQEDFARYRDSLRLDYENFSRQEPIVQAGELMRHLLNEGHVTPADKARAIRKISHQQLVLFFESFRDRTYVEGVLFGNMEPQIGIQVPQIVRDTLQRDPFLAAEHTPPRVLVLPQQEGPFYLIKPVKSQGNAVLLAIDEGPYSFKRRGAQQILAVGIEAPFFQELRTRQQTGYLVSSWSKDIEEHLFSFFAVQSNRYDGQELLARFELFTEQFLQELEETTLTQERFDTIRRNLIRQLQDPPKNPAEMGDLLASLAFDHDGKFDWINQRIRGLQSLSYQEFIQIAQDFLSRANKHRIAILVEGKTEENPLKYRRVRSANQLREMSSYQSRREIHSN